MHAKNALVDDDRLTGLEPARNHGQWTRTVRKVARERRRLRAIGAGGACAGRSARRQGEWQKDRVVQEVVNTLAGSVLRTTRVGAWGLAIPCPAAVHTWRAVRLLPRSLRRPALLHSTARGAYQGPWISRLRRESWSRSGSSHDVPSARRQAPVKPPR